MGKALVKPDRLATIAPLEALARQGCTALALEKYRSAVDVGTIWAPRYGKRGIDLHMFHEDVAILAILDLMQTVVLLEENDSLGADLRVITGRGKHSVDHVP